LVRFGNRWNVLFGNGTQQALTFNTLNQMPGWGYDAAGDVTNDPQPDLLL